MASGYWGKEFTYIKVLSEGDRIRIGSKIKM